MQRHLWKIGLWIALVISVCSVQKLPAEGCAKQTTECLHCNESYVSELTILASPEDIYVDDSNILLDVEGSTYIVHRLERIGDQWLATVVNTNNVNYCPRGHLTCRGCGLCHTRSCNYYVKPCKLWDGR